MELKHIGTGSFTKAYLKENGKVLLKSEDPIKQAISEGALPKHRMFPQLKLVNVTNQRHWYETNFVIIVKGRSHIENSTSARQQKFWNLITTSWGIRQGVNAIRNHFESLPNAYDREKVVLLKALEGLKHFGDDLVFETPLCNMAIKNRKLIFLDCFFLRSKLIEVRERRR